MDEITIEEGIIKKDPETGLEMVQGENGLWGLVDKDDIFLTSHLYKNIEPFNGGFSIVQGKNFLYGVIDTLGREIVPCKYESISFRNDGFIRVEFDGLYGLYDIFGKKVINCCYKYINQVSEVCLLLKTSVDYMAL